MMKREIFVTADGSHSLRIPGWDEQYHSRHGAIREAVYVFINRGLQYRLDKHRPAGNLSILEIGFGTGLNALLTALYVDKHKVKVDYCGVEAFPLEATLWKKLNYAQLVQADSAPLIYQLLHDAPWDQNCIVTPNFTLHKCRDHIESFCQRDAFDLIYFDAFGARVQPELWTDTVFENMYQSLKKEGVLVTYSSKGSVRRAMLSAGFKVEKLPGPPGKREMLRAVKT